MTESKCTSILKLNTDDLKIVMSIFECKNTTIIVE